MDFHSVRKQPGRALLLFLACSSVLLFFLNQSHLAAPFKTDPRSSPRFQSVLADTPNARTPIVTPYAQRRIQDYQSPEYTAPGDTAPQPPQKAPPNEERQEERGGGGGGEEQVEEEEEEEEEEEQEQEEEEEEATGDEGRKENSTESIIASILDQQRQQLLEDMKDYVFHPKLKARSANDLVLEQGGRPVRSLVITTWRSGSTFIGDVLQSHPGTYYHYEPLLDFGINQVRYGQDATQALHNLRHLLTCDYSEMEHYLDFGPDHPWLFTHNQVLWSQCQAYPDLCWKPEFLSPFCSLFPFQSLKTVRLRLNLTQELLQDKKLGVQVLLLVRDPRGTMQSRRHRDWCPGEPDCDDPARLCGDLVSDYNTALVLRRKFPHSFRAVRYEDLSFDAYNMTKELFDFFHLSYHPRVQSFLDTHTKQTIGGVSSTFRDSKTAPIHWKTDLAWAEVERIQKACHKALKLWGYNVARNEEHLRAFMPVGRFKFP